MGWVAAVQAIAAIIGAAASAKAATNETNMSEENTAQPGGATFGGAGPFNTQEQAPSDIGSILASITGGQGGQGISLDNIASSAQAAAAGTQQAAQVAPSDPGLDAPAGDGATPDPSAEITDPKAGQDIGQILAAIPQALVAAGSLLGVNDVDTVTSRPAPVAGGGGGGLVGQFNRPLGQGSDIGQLLAALPGLR